MISNQSTIHHTPVVSIHPATTLATAVVATIPPAHQDVPTGAAWHNTSWVNAIASRQQARNYMSRTTLRYLNGPRRDDGTHCQTRVVRDDRVTGLREHRRDRRAAKTALTSGGGDDLPNGTPPLQRPLWRIRAGAGLPASCNRVTVRPWTDH